MFDDTTGELEICGGLTIVKETDPAGEDQDFDFTITGPGIDGTGEFELNAADHDEGEGNPASTTFSDLLIGDYTITEVDIPDGWDLTSIVCDDGTTGNLADDAVTVSVGVSTGVTCTFTNTLRHSILVEKTYAVDPG
ncbi:prealbumin-like fold domain-containing protein, partial [Nitriliruptor alkaliphilus]|uniref:prealbumin-like fold domain-containing protein n=1 Tax=Nitriliruptor alkaliphilus TaxID=427918 RepID=UPI000695ACA0